MELNIYQKKAVMAPEPRVLCLASAASGKTSTIVERIRYLIQDKGVAAKDIVAITYTRMAAEEMKRRLGSIVTETFIGTIHAYATYICELNNISVYPYVITERFDKILEEACMVSVKKYPHISHLLVDECQDVMPEEELFLTRIPAENAFFVGDDRQQIYTFRGSSDKFLRSMYDDENVAKYQLRYNYRNAPNIIKFANSFLGSYTPLSYNSLPVKQEDGYIENCQFFEALEALKETDNYGSWFILTRSNAQIEKAQQILEEEKIPHVTFRKSDLNLEDLDLIMSENRVKILTAHAAKGLEAPNVIVTGMCVYNLDERKLAYVAATRAENNLYWCPAVGPRKKKKGEHISEKLRGGRIFDKAPQEMIKFG